MRKLKSCKPSKFVYIVLRVRVKIFKKVEVDVLAAFTNIRHVTNKSVILNSKWGYLWWSCGVTDLPEVPRQWGLGTSMTANSK